MSDDTIPRVLRLMWGREELAGRRGPKPNLTVADIARAAVRVADADGLAAVSMARVAGELSFTSMSLYRYIEAKDDLYVLMLDRAFGPYPVVPDGGWREQIYDWAHAIRAVFHRHPWVVQIPVHEPPLAPNQVSWMEAGLDALADTALSGQQRLMAMLLVDNYVRGQAQLGGPADGDQGDYGARLTSLIDAERFPQLWAAMTSGAFADDEAADAANEAEEQFEFGLDTVLTGIQDLTDGAAAARRTASGRGRRRA